MVEASPDDPSLLEPSQSHASPLPLRADDNSAAHPLGQSSFGRNDASASTRHSHRPSAAACHGVSPSTSPNITADKHVNDPKATPAPPAPPPSENGHGEESPAIESAEIEKKPNLAVRSYRVCKEILFSSWLNVLLVFVPVGVAVNFAGVNGSIVFAMNAIAIIPLAGLLSHATESVASDMGDTIGSLMNVTFGNAVELIIFIALTKVYNSTATQMSACLLSLSVMSLLLPTAFHASFTNSNTADKAVLQVSRGTSIILLLVYVLYLLFQLKSHAYMYQSTPQSVIDEESHPGLLHDVFDPSSSSDTSSSLSDSDSDASSASVTTAKRIRRVLRGRKRRKSSASSKDTPSVPSTLRTPSVGTFNAATENHELNVLESRGEPFRLGAIASGDEADTDGENDLPSRATRNTLVNFRDFENEKHETGSRSPEIKMKKKQPKKKHRKRHKHGEKAANEIPEKAHLEKPPEDRPTAPLARVGFVQDIHDTHESSPKRQLTLRGFSVREIVPTIPAVQNMLSSTVFSAANPTGPVGGGVAATGVTPRALHRSNSLPSRLNQTPAARQLSNPPAQPQQDVPPTEASSTKSGDSDKSKKHMSRSAAIILLLVSTGLVALCAEFLVSSIGYLISNSPVSEAFIGLIIIPIVGNAAEHVTAVTVASKNKMDLAIGVAVGSSIQIALFVTPVIVLLGWILNKNMSLYFSLFETISLFVSAFIVNFLVLDGRSNYLEGALLIAAYIIIALAAFFYPDSSNQSTIGGGPKLVFTRAIVDVVDLATRNLL